ncbi:hypothetical protein BC937DRAFT_95138 [Endogone sp. FLAS-F59071]|nr:hypothetical protein BC937DRAFT_95138 [Endogone sp. FLAS-F59071]|eukprot:RUS13558.1 hypothetical protein BC937DRAFT_95138 [Endogone sp. FLAS-F59071]
MNAEIIRNSYSIAATQVLSCDIFISPNVGAHFKSSGYLNFWVNDGQCWAIELLWDGSDAFGHKAHFDKGGIYVPIREMSKEWATIDIRHPGLPNYEPEYKVPHWISVYCQENWKSVIIEDYEEDGRVRRVEV